MIGIDLVHVPEFKKRLEQGGTSFLEHAFHTQELQNSQPEHLAGLWAAKEAVLKALDLAVDDWLKITVTYSVHGRPSAQANGQAIDISIAHHGEYAVAVAQVPMQVAA